MPDQKHAAYSLAGRLVQQYLSFPVPESQVVLVAGQVGRLQQLSGIGDIQHKLPISRRISLPNPSVVVALDLVAGFRVDHYRSVGEAQVGTGTAFHPPRIAAALLGQVLQSINDRLLFRNRVASLPEITRIVG